MPLYQYECRNCEHELEEVQGFNDSPLSKCPECNKETLFRVITGGLGFFTANRTVGAVCDKNDACFSEDFKQHLSTKNETKKVDKLSEKLAEGNTIQKPPKKPSKPWYKTGNEPSSKKLQGAKPDQLNKYIETGKLT